MRRRNRYNHPIILHPRRSSHSLNEPILVLIRQILQRPILRLRQQQRRPHARQHEEREYLQNMLHEVVRPPDILQPREPDLRKDSTELARRCADTMRSRPVTRGEGLAGDDEGCGVRPEVLEEVREAVEEGEPLRRVVRRCELVVAEAHDDEEDGEDGKAHELDGLAAPRVDEEEGGVISWDKTSRGEDDVANADVLEILVCLGGALKVCSRGSEADGVEDDG